MMIQKCTLFFYFFFSLLARCSSFLCSLTLPAININNFLQNQTFKEKPELQNFLSDERFRIEFNTYRVKILDDVFKGMLANLWIIGVFYACHVVILSLHYAIFLRKFKALSLRELLINLLGNVFVPLPFQPLSSSSWKQQTILLLVLSLVENVGLVFICLFASSSSLDRIWDNILILLLPIIIPNTISILLLVVYHSYLDPWKLIIKSSLPPDIPNFKEEVVFIMEDPNFLPSHLFFRMCCCSSQKKVQVPDFMLQSHLIFEFC